MIRSYLRPKKLDNILFIIRECIEDDRIADTIHSLERRKQRDISLIEIIHVLKTRRHEKNKDCFDEIFRSWNYSIRGITIDKKDLRVIVAFDKDTNLLLITAFYLGKEN